MVKRNTPQFRALIAIGVGVLALLITQFVLPGSAGGSRGTPLAILFTGLVFGALNGITAIGLVLIYRTSRVINFSQAALGAIGAIFAYNAEIVYHWPYGLAFAVAVIISAAVGAVAELLLRRFFQAPRLVVTIFTIGVGGLIAFRGVGTVSSLPIWGDRRDLIESFGGSPVVPVRSVHFHLGNLALNFVFAHILALIMTVVCLAAVAAFLRFTRLGIAVRASSENTERAELLGINVRNLSLVVWIVAGALAGVSVTLVGTLQGFQLANAGAPVALIAALTAAIIARMRSFPIAVYAALVIAVMQEAFRWSYRDQSVLVDAGLFLVIAVALLFQRDRLGRTGEASAWEATEEIRPTPRELLDVGGVRTWRRLLVGIAGVAVLALPWMVSSGVVNRASFSAIYAIVFLSLVVLTGWAGQVSLGQFGLVAVGALVGGALTSRAGISFWFALPIGAIVTSVVALVIGLPALRIRGLFLAVVTLAFATAASTVLFSERYFKWLQPANINRPSALLLDFEDERSMYYLCIFFLALAILLVVTLRRSRPGRVLIGMRENETELQAFGINIVRTKLSAFVLSGFLCGVAGVLYAHHQRAVEQSAFLPQASISVFIFAIVGGIGSVSGAMFGAALQAASQFFPNSQPVLAAFINEYSLLLYVLYIAPGGVASIAYSVRDSVLRIVAQRQQIVVPSLFADLDPAVLESQKIPLGESEGRSGLDSIAPGEGYRLGSGLYAPEEIDSSQGAPDERAVLGDVAERVGSDT